MPTGGDTSLFSPVIQGGFACLCVIQLGILAFVIRWLLIFVASELKLIRSQHTELVEKMAVITTALASLPCPANKDRLDRLEKKVNNVGDQKSLGQA